MPLVHPAIVSGGNENHGQPLQVDSSGNLLVNIAQGSISASSGAAYNSTPPTFVNGTTNPLQMDVNGNLKVAGTINASSSATYNSTPPTLANGASGALQSDVNGKLLVNDGYGLANPIRTDPTGTTTQPVAVSGATFDGSGNLNVNVQVGGGTGGGGTQYADGATQVTPTGTVALGKNPSNVVKALSVDASANLNVNVATALPSGANVIGALTANQSINLTQINGSAAVTGATGTLKVAITGNTGSALDGSVGSANPSSVLGVTGFPTISANGSLSVNVQAALTTANAKATAGAVYGLTIYNPNSAAIFLQFYNTAGAPTLGTGVVWSVPVAPTSSLTISVGPVGLAQFTTGIGIGAATTATGAVAPTTPPSVTVFYK